MMRMIPKFSYDKHPDMFIETYKTHKLKEKKRLANRVIQNYMYQISFSVSA